MATTTLIHSGQPPAEPLTIRALLVDDDPTILAVLSTFLRRKGYAVDIAPDGQAALLQLQDTPANLVVTDRHMPHVDGLELCRAIRAQAREQYVYCIMLTGTGDADALVAAMEAGVDDFIAKPLHVGELNARLKAAERVLALEADLASRNRRLAEAYGQLSRELELARQLQLDQLPPPAAFGPLRFDWIFEASSFVGGDIFDYFMLGEQHLCFHLADVSGHGVAAAMMAFNAQHQVLASTRQVVPPLLRQGASLEAAAVAAVEEYNRRFLQTMKETSLYLTMVYGLVDLATGRGAIVQAGHPPPLLAGPGEAAFTPIGEGGLPIGIVPDADYEAHAVSLAPGSRLLLYSDGVTDCRDAQDEAFGEERLRQILQAGAVRGLAAAGEDVLAALQGWRGGPSFEDDVTLLALEVR